MLTGGAEQPTESYANLVPISTDTDGSIYNSVGYRENVRLSSSGDISSTAQEGSVTTGFMPYTYIAPLIVRMKGATWLGESDIDPSTHWYLNFYDSDKTLILSIMSSALGTSGEDGSLGSFVKVSYDATTDITTFDFSKVQNYSSNITAVVSIKSGSYIRINAKGKGADLIVTVNREISL